MTTGASKRRSGALPALLCLVAVGVRVGAATTWWDGLIHTAPTTPVTPLAGAGAWTGVRGYGRFHANDSHVGRPVPCTRDEKVCFRHNLIFSPRSDRCEALGGGGHSCFLAADRQEFEHGSGHIVGVCRKYDDPCRYFIGYRTAYDTRCYDKNIIFKVICGCDGGLTAHFLGGDECRCSRPDPINVTQPEEEGRCLIPDFRNPRPTHAAFYKQPLDTQEPFYARLNCSEEQRRCFQGGKVRVAGASGCHALLKRGPCPAEHVVAIDGRASVRGRAEGVCVHERGNCPPGHKRMGFDNECHADRDIAIAAPGVIVLNAYGVHEVLYYAIGIYYSTTLEGDMCQVEFLKMWPPLNIIDYPAPICTDEDKSQCFLNEVVSTPPPPDTDQ